MTISPFDARLQVRDQLIVWIPVRDFNHQLEKVVGCKVLQFIPMMKIKKMLGHKTLRCTNTTTSYQLTVPYTNLQLNPYPNTQLDLFCSDNFSFWCTAPSTWPTNCTDPSTRLQSPTREDCWLQSSSVHPDDEDQKDAWSQNPMVHKQNNFFTRMMN